MLLRVEQIDAQEVLDVYLLLRGALGGDPGGVPTKWRSPIGGEV